MTSTSPFTHVLSPGEQCRLHWCDTHHVLPPWDDPREHTPLQQLLLGRVRPDAHDAAAVGAAGLLPGTAATGTDPADGARLIGR